MIFFLSHSYIFSLLCKINVNTIDEIHNIMAILDQIYEEEKDLDTDE